MPDPTDKDRPGGPRRFAVERSEQTIVLESDDNVLWLHNAHGEIILRRQVDGRTLLVMRDRYGHPHRVFLGPAEAEALGLTLRREAARMRRETERT